MKIVFTFFAVVLLAASINAQIVTEEKKKTVTETGDTVYTESTILTTSEDITPRNDMIVINPLKFFLFYNLTYFHKFSDKLGFGVGFQIPTLSGLGGFGVNGELRVYPSGRTLRGFYIAPNIAYNHITAGESSISPFSIGALVGWQWFPGDDFAIGLGIGADYYTGTVNDADNDNFESYSGTVPVVRFDIGYAW